jgi:seryl-tRNA synthetase
MKSGARRRNAAMIDLKELKARKEEIIANVANRCMKVDVEAIIELQERRSLLLQETESLRSKRNENALRMKGKLDQESRLSLVNEGKALKEEIALKESLLAEVEKSYLEKAREIPNYAHPSAPVGKLDSDNLEISRWGTAPVFNFQPKDHVQLGEALDLIDFDTATRVSGPKFYYLKNEAVLLELALERSPSLLILRKKRCLSA